MKTALFILKLLFAVNLNAQESTFDTLDIQMVAYSPNNEGSIIGDGFIPYIVGSYKFPSYGEIETRTCTAEESMTLPNGRRIAGLSCILFDADQYVGGNMVFENDTTIITDISVVPVGEGALFTVKGKDFTMSFTLSTGLILRYEYNHATFNTEDRGVWTIYKKV
ncbi:MAG: hypothetical protein HRU43_07065 [Simkaniaceae bacterium]|nr:hypothetical protein [Simkaniaceae bacterium]